MKKNDINLFKAAGGERAKGSKRSAFFYVVVLAIVISVIAIGVAVYFNTRVSSEKASYATKQQTLNNYLVTKKNKDVIEKSQKYQSVIANIETANAINSFIKNESKMYPHATETEVNALHDAILSYNGGSGFSLNDIDSESGERFTAWDYSQVRKDLYSQEENVTDIEDSEKSLFYFALESLEEAQKASPDTNVWHSYYRGYMVIVFTGADYGVSSLAADLMNGSLLDGNSPFMKLDMEQHAIEKTGYIVSRDVTYNVMLCPLKSVFNRMFDVLEAHSNDLKVRQGLSDAQTDFVSYAVDELTYVLPDLDDVGEKVEPKLSFKLCLPKENDLPGYLDCFTSSPFFKVANPVKDSAETSEGSEYYIYTVELQFTGEY